MSGQDSDSPSGRMDETRFEIEAPLEFARFPSIMGGNESSRHGPIAMPTVDPCSIDTQRPLTPRAIRSGKRFDGPTTPIGRKFVAPLDFGAVLNKVARLVRLLVVRRMNAADPFCPRPRDPR